MEEVTCSHCNGSGEGMVNGTFCTRCGGYGVEYVEIVEDDEE